jgi:hypothetical protein
MYVCIYIYTICIHVCTDIPLVSKSTNALWGQRAGRGHRDLGLCTQGVVIRKLLGMGQWVPQELDG